jgi:hypothetical protein
VEAMLYCGFIFLGSVIPGISRKGNTAYLTSSGVQNFALTIVTTIDTTLTNIPQIDFKHAVINLGNINRISSTGSASSIISNLTVAGTITIYKQ